MVLSQVNCLFGDKPLLNSYSLASIAAEHPLAFSLGIVILFLGGVIAVAERVNRSTPADAELTRKVVHIGVGNVILLAWWLNIPTWTGIAASIVAGAIALISYFVPILPSINSVGRKSLGTFFYAVSIGILIAWFWSTDQRHFAVLGVLVMTWGDGMAALLGQRFGKHRYQILGITKSWEGSLAMAVVSYLVTNLVLLAGQELSWQIWVVSLAVAVIATALEAVSKLGVDNLTVPLGSAAVGFFVSQLLSLT